MPVAQPSLTSGGENYPETTWLVTQTRGEGEAGGMSSEHRPRPITQTAKNVISEKQVLSHVLMIGH